MCGFAGCLTSQRVTEESLCGMIATLRHRGPDDEGVWLDAELGIGLAHARLAIIDVSTAGHQPMLSNSGRYVITYNGEAYNHLVLRSALEQERRAPQWRGHSDTETLLAGFDAWGIEQTITKTVGMFAFAVWDRHARTLTLARDRIGEKPLYYGWQRDTFFFASELKALKEHPAFSAEIDRDALTLLLRHNCIPAPYSIYRGIHKLLPGSLLTTSLGNRHVQPRRYWDVRQVVADGCSRRFPGTAEDAVVELESTLRDAVTGQLMSDVPLGAFLSGGIDSSTIVALMQQESPRPVQTFTIGFRETGYDEAEPARAVARHLRTDHTELYVTPEQALDVIPRLPSLYCEPFADSSQIPTFLVSQLARQHVTVALSGDAGDELFAGYNRYALSKKLWGTLSRLPISLRATLSRRIAGVPAQRWNRILEPIQALLPTALAQANVGDKMVKGAEVMAATSTSELYRSLVSHWMQPDLVVRDAAEPQTILTDAIQRPSTGNFVQDMMALDLLTYLPDDILVKVDRAAMGVGLETRMPLLDHRVVEFAWRLPLDFKLRNGTSKWPLRQVLDKYVPRTLIERPKMGFAIPIHAWLRGPLRDWAESLLDESRLKRDGLFHVAPIREKWYEHRSGARNWQYQLWDILMIQAWLAEQG